MTNIKAPSGILVLAALAIGVLGGLMVSASGWSGSGAAIAAAQTIGGLWLDALKMTVIPLVVALVITGVVTGAEQARAGGMARRTIAWIVSLVALSAVVGALVTPLLLSLVPVPAAAANVLAEGLGSVDKAAAAAAVPSWEQLARSFVADNLFAAAADGRILALVVFALLFGFALSRLDAARRTLLAGFFDAFATALLVIVGWVLWLTPLGAAALSFAVVASTGAEAILALGHYIVIVSAVGCVMMGIMILLGLLVARYPLGGFARAMAPVSGVALSTQSSLASLPAMLVATAQLGVGARSRDLVLPIAVALFRSTGPAMNIAVAIYVAHWMGMDLSWGAILVGVLVAAVTTFGAVSLPGSLSFVTSIAPIALAMGVPIAPLAILVAVEIVPDLIRTLGNVVADVVLSGIIARQEDDVAAEVAGGGGHREP